MRLIARDLGAMVAILSVVIGCGSNSGGTGGTGGAGAACGATGGSGGSTVTPVTPNSITCGSQCCALSSSPGCCDTPSAPSCTNAACSPAALYKCDGPEDCAGKACCGAPSGGSACATTTTCATGQDTYCHAAQDCPSSHPRCVEQDSMTPGMGDAGGVLGAVLAICRQ